MPGSFGKPASNGNKLQLIEDHNIVNLHPNQGTSSLSAAYIVYQWQLLTSLYEFLISSSPLHTHMSTWHVHMHTRTHSFLRWFKSLNPKFFRCSSLQWKNSSAEMNGTTKLLEFLGDVVYCKYKLPLLLLLMSLISLLS